MLECFESYECLKSLKGLKGYKLKKYDNIKSLYFSPRSLSLVAKQLVATNSR